MPWAGAERLNLRARAGRGARFSTRPQQGLAPPRRGAGVVHGPIAHRGRPQGSPRSGAAARSLDCCHGPTACPSPPGCPARAGTGGRPRLRGGAGGACGRVQQAEAARGGGRRRGARLRPRRPLRRRAQGKGVRCDRCRGRACAALLALPPPAACSMPGCPWPASPACQSAAAPSAVPLPHPATPCHPPSLPPGALPALQHRLLPAGGVRGSQGGV